MPPINEYDDMITNISQESQPAQAAPAPQPASSNQVQVQAPDDYDSMLNQEKDAQKTQLQSSMMVAAQTEPDRRAKVLELSQKMNLPPNIVERNFDDVQKKAVQASVDYDGIINNTPGLAKWLENPDNASIGRNDIDPLERIDESIRVVTPNRSQSGLLDFPADLTRAGKTGFNNLRASAWHLGAAYGLIDVREAANQIAESNKRAQELQAKMPDYSQEFNKAMAQHGGDTNKAFAQFTSSFDEYRDGKILDALKDFGGGGAATVGETIDMIKAAAVRPRGLIYSTVENLAQSLPSLLTGAAGAAIAGPVGFVGGSFAGQVPVEVGSWISESMAKRGIDTTDPDQIVAAYQNPQFMAEIRSQAERKGLTTAAVDSVFNAFAGKVFAGAHGATGLKKVVAGVADVGVQAVGESASEFSGQVAAQKGDLSKVDFGESIQEGITSLGHAMGETVVGSAASVRNKFAKQPVHAAQEIAIVTDNALQAQSDAQSLAHIGGAVKEVSFAQSMPGKLKELVDIASKGDEAAAVYFDVPAWDEHWTKQGKSPAQMAEQIMGDGGHRYFEAKESGALMEVPMSDYISHVAPTPDFEAMLPFTRTRADGMTLQEAKEHLAALPATMEELAKEATGQPPEVMTTQDNQTQAKTIGDTITEKLKTAGFDDKTAGTYSKVYEKAFGTLADRAGVDAKGLFEQYNLNVNKLETEAALGSDEQRLNQPARTLLFPVKEKQGVFTVKPADDMNASVKRAGQSFEIKDLNYNPKYLGVVQDMLRSLEKVASFNGATQMTAKTEGMAADLKSAYQAQGFNEVDGQMVKSINPDKQTLRQDTRGQIRFGKDGINIDILKGADLSTFLHETGHFYLEVLGDLATKEGMSQQIKDDYASILKWLGANDRGSITTDQHEQFARGFESYLMEGKAPSRDLQQAFTRFKVWLTEIYKQLKNLAVDLTPEVRDVFNRMLATDEEISDATAEQSLDPIFKDPAAFGMTGKKAEDYITAREEARSFAENKLFNQLMEKHRQEKAQWYKDQKANVKAEMTKQVDGSVLYRAIAIMRSGTLADGSPAPEGTTNIKLDRQSIVAAYGEDFVKSLPSGVVASKKGDGGIHFDAAAPLFGFESGDSMLKQLSNAPKKEETINQLTQARMNELHPDLLTEDPEKLNDEAMKAIHNDARAKMLRMELEHMVTMNPSSVKEVVKRTARRVPTQAQIRDQAEKAIGRRNTGDLNPYLFQRAERKYAKEAGELLTKGDFDGAFQSKQKELYNHELYRAATEAGDRVEKDLAKFKRISKSDEKVSKTRDIDLVNAARAVLTRFGIGKADKTVEDYLGQMRQYDPDTYNTMMSLVNSATQNVGPYQSVPYDDFVAMSDSVNAIWDLAKSKQEILAEGERHNIDDVKQQLAGKINEIAPEGKQMGYDKAVSDMDKVKVQLLGARASLTRVEHWTEAVDVKAGGPFKKFIWTPISEATTQYRLAKEKVLKEYKTILEDLRGTTAPKPIDAKEIGYTFKDRTELLMAVLHTGNESNFSKLLRGRKWGDTDMNGNLDTSKWDAFIKRAHDEKILTKADYDFAQKIWNLMESIKPDAQKAHKDMYGYYFNEITAKKIQTPFGEYAGGYIPAKVDIYTNEDASIRHEREEFERNNNSFQFPTTGRGFTKSRVDQYAAPLSLEMSMLGGHIDGVMRFAHIEPAVKKTARIVHDKEFRSVLSKLDPAVGKELLTPWLQRAAQQKVVFPSDTGIGKLTDGVAKFLRSTVAMQLMVGNVSNTLQQATGLVVAMAKVAPRNIRNALVTYVGDIKGTTEAALEKSEWMRSAQGSSIYETSQAIEQIIVDPTTFDTVKAFAKKHTYFMQTAAQNMVNTIVWTAAYDQAIEKGALETEAVRTADGAVRTTQGTNNPEDISRFETGTPTQRLFTQFAGYFNMLANLNGSELQKISREVGLKKGAGRAFYVYLTAFMLPAVLSEGIMRAMSGKGADANDDDKYLDDALAVFFGSQFKTATAAIPYAGQALNATYNNFNNNLNDDRMSLSPVISTIESMAGVPAEIYKTMHGDVANKKRVVKDALMLTGVLSNLPIGPIGKPVGYAMDLKSGRARPSGPIDAARGYITGAPGKAK